MKNLIRFLMIFNFFGVAHFAFCENIKPYVPLLDSLISKKQLNAANELAQRMLVFADDSMRKDIYFKQGLILIELDMPYEAYQQFHMAYEDKYTSADEKSKALIYTSLCFVQMEEYGTALHFLQAYPIVDNWKGLKNIVAGYSSYMMKDYKSAKEYFDNAGLENYNSLFNKHLRRLERAKTIAIISSIVVPGFGQTILGKPLNGATALVVNVGLGLLVINATPVSILQAALFVMPVFTRYYIGNIARTVNFADDNIKKVKKNNVKKLLNNKLIL